jgi:hypothetical protein
MEDQTGAKMEHLKYHGGGGTGRSTNTKTSVIVLRIGPGQAVRVLMVLAAVKCWGGSRRKEMVWKPDPFESHHLWKPLEGT